MLFSPIFYDVICCVIVSDTNQNFRTHCIDKFCDHNGLWQIHVDKYESEHLWLSGMVLVQLLGE